jgi:hypothetical protein
MANGWFDFVNGQTLPASRVQDYLMNQSVMVFADDSARTSALYGITTQGMVTYLVATNALEMFDGLNWVSTSPPVVIPETLSPILLIGA